MRSLGWCWNSGALTAQLCRREAQKAPRRTSGIDPARPLESPARVLYSAAGASQLCHTPSAGSATVENHHRQQRRRHPPEASTLCKPLLLAQNPTSPRASEPAGEAGATWTREARPQRAPLPSRIDKVSYSAHPVRRFLASRRTRWAAIGRFRTSYLSKCHISDHGTPGAATSCRACGCHWARGCSARWASCSRCRRGCRPVSESGRYCCSLRHGRRRAAAHGFSPPAMLRRWSPRLAAAQGK